MKARVRVAVRRRPEPTPWWIWAVLAVGMVALAPHGRAQTVPSSPTLPPGSGGDRTMEVRPPATDSTLVPPEGGIRRPVPDPGIQGPGASGVIAPGQTGQMPVLRPPATGDMPVVRPPGSAGGDPKVVPK